MVRLVSLLSDHLQNEGKTLTAIFRIVKNMINIASLAIGHTLIGYLLKFSKLFHRQLL
jgi:hypothetical protein